MDTAAALAELIRSDRERLSAVAADVVESSPEMRGRYSADEIDQLVNGFRTLMLEALEGGDGGTRALFLETAVPALVADGQTPAAIVRAAVTFGIGISCDLAWQVDASLRSDAQAWLAAFFGDYCHDLVAAAEGVR